MVTLCWKNPPWPPTSFFLISFSAASCPIIRWPNNCMTSAGSKWKLGLPIKPSLADTYWCVLNRLGRSSYMVCMPCGAVVILHFPSADKMPEHSKSCVADWPFFTLSSSFSWIDHAICHRIKLEKIRQSSTSCKEFSNNRMTREPKRRWAYRENFGKYDPIARGLPYVG